MGSKISLELARASCGEPVLGATFPPLALPLLPAHQSCRTHSQTSWAHRACGRLAAPARSGHRRSSGLTTQSLYSPAGRGARAAQAPMERTLVREGPSSNGASLVMQRLYSPRATFHTARHALKMQACQSSPAPCCRSGRPGAASAFALGLAQLGVGGAHQRTVLEAANGSVFVVNVKGVPAERQQCRASERDPAIRDK